MKRSSTVAGVLMGMAILLAACGGGDDEAAEPSGGGATSGGSMVTIEGFAFKPASITVPAGTEVVWTNKDGAAHNIQPSDDLFDTSPDIKGDTVFKHTYDKAGSFPYVCGIHNYMTGTVVVT